MVRRRSGRLAEKHGYAILAGEVLAMPDIVDEIARHVVQYCDLKQCARYRLVNKAFCHSMDPFVVWQIAFWERKDERPRRTLALQKMLKRRPTLVAHIDRIAFFESRPPRQWCTELIPQASNLTYLLVTDGLRALGVLYAEKPFLLPNLVELEIFVQVSSSHQQANTLPRSLSSIESLAVWLQKAGGLLGQRMPLSAYSLDTLLSGSISQVKHLKLSLANVSTCTSDEIATVIHSQETLRDLTFALPAEMHIEGLLRSFPTKLETFTVHCGLKQAKTICNDLEDGDALPMLKHIPLFRILRQDPLDSNEPVHLPIRYAQKAISGLMKRANFV